MKKRREREREKYLSQPNKAPDPVSTLVHQALCPSGMTLNGSHPDAPLLSGLPVSKANRRQRGRSEEGKRGNSGHLFPGSILPGLPGWAGRYLQIH